MIHTHLRKVALNVLSLVKRT